MDTTLAESTARHPPSRFPLTPTAAVLLAIALGLCGGYLDLGIILFKKTCWNSEGSYRNARDFPWTVPVGHVVVLLIPGVVVAAVSRFWPGRVSLRQGVWLLATLAITGALLRLPLYPVCSLVLAMGLAGRIGDAVATRDWHCWPVRPILAALLVVLGALAALSSGWQAFREYRTIAGLPAPPANARNVVFLVWDTVRAHDLSLNGNPRRTTPNLARWARKGVQYDFALAPAPWTFPSHCSFFTGRWPFQLDAQWKSTLESPDATLAEYLAARGYQTVGFAANTNCCTYETGLARGFTHFEDYAPTPWAPLSRTVAGKWILQSILSWGSFHERKWFGLQSRDARALNDAFLDWLAQGRTDRPFFAFLNYFDAHEPYIPPASYEGRCGIRPAGPRDYRFLVDYVEINKDTLQPRDLVMAHDCYSDCIVFLDEQLGRLLDQLQARGLLENTAVILTSDHGESFGEHGSFGHSYTVNLEEICVPLVILSPGAPAGRLVYHPVSLRDLPATVVDLLGLAAGSPFPGHSLAAYWGLRPGQTPEIASPVLTEQVAGAATVLQNRTDPGHPAFQMSLVDLGHHYIRHSNGAEQLYDVVLDPYERVNLMAIPRGSPWAGALRRRLLEALTENPGSVQVEQAYLKTYRQELEGLVHGPDRTLMMSAAR